MVISEVFLGLALAKGLASGGLAGGSRCDLRICGSTPPDGHVSCADCAAAGAGVVAALASSRVGQKQFMPTALLAQHLPAGLGSMCNVPRLSDMVAETEAARLEEYIITIRRHGTATPAHVCLVGAPSPQLEAWGALGAGVVDGRAIGSIAESLALLDARQGRGSLLSALVFLVRPLANREELVAHVELLQDVVDGEDV